MKGMGGNSALSVSEMSFHSGPDVFYMLVNILAPSCLIIDVSQQNAMKSQCEFPFLISADNLLLTSSGVSLTIQLMVVLRSDSISLY